MTSGDFELTPLPDKIGEWDIELSLGRGAHGEVYEGSSTEFGLRAAIKVMDVGVGRTEVERMVQIGRLLPGGVPSILGSSKLDNDRVFIAMDLCDRGSLQRRIGEIGRPLSVDEVMHLARSLKSLVGGLHRIGYLHGDLKPGNLLLRARASEHSDSAHVLLRDDEDLLLCDFATVRPLGEPDDLVVAAGTPGYSAPEINDGKTKASGAADVYSASAMMVELLTGASPRRVGSRSENAFEPDAWAATGSLKGPLRRGLSFEPYDRQQTMAHWWDELSSAHVMTLEMGDDAPEAPTPERTTRSVPRKRATLTALAVVVLLATTTMGLALASVSAQRSTASPSRQIGAVTEVLPTADSSIANDPRSPAEADLDSGALDPGSAPGESVEPASPEVALASDTLLIAEPSSAQPAPALEKPGSTTIAGANRSEASTAPAALPAGPTTTVRSPSPSQSPSPNPSPTSAQPTTAAGPASLAAQASAGGPEMMAQLAKDILQLCVAKSGGNHGDVVRIGGIDHEVVVIAVDRSSEPLAEGGYKIGHTGTGPYLIVGSAGPDIITGHQANDVICGMGGNDDINAKGGDNFLLGGSGNDTIEAWSGVNVLLGESGDKDLLGGTGDGEDWCSDLARARSGCDHRIRVFDPSSPPTS